MTQPKITCPNGHENEPGGRFCETCGAALGAPAAPQPAAAPSGQGTGSGPSMVMILVIAAFVAVAASIATVGAFVLFAGDDDEPAAAEPTPAATATATAEPSPTPASEAGATRENPLPLGAASRGPDGWEVFVVRSDFDAVQEVLAENRNNVPPMDGFTYALVRVNATNREAEPDEGEDVTEYSARVDFYLVDEAGNEYFTFANDGCGPYPDGFAFLDNPQPQGGTVEGNLCFHLPLDVTDDVVAYNDVHDRWFALR